MSETVLILIIVLTYIVFMTVLAIVGASILLSNNGKWFLNILLKRKDSEIDQEVSTTLNVKKTEKDS